MKPKTKLQFRVTKLSKQLPNLTKAQEQWAKIVCLDHKGFMTKNRVMCMDCGKPFSPDLVSRKRATCPHCHTKLNITVTRKRTDKQIVYFAIADIVEDFQVISFYELFGYYKAGKKAKYWSQEILEHWILPDGKREVIGLLHHLNWYCDSWNGDWSIRNKKDTRKFDVYPFKYHPESRFKKEYRKIGINKNLAGITFLDALNIIPIYPHAETLLKAKRFDLLSAYSDYNKKNRAERYWPSLKVCLRNNYRITDLTIFFDYLDLLAYFRKDLHNAKYVCPKDMKAEHDRLVEKKRQNLEKSELEEKKRKAIEDQKLLADHVKDFLGLQFSNDKITIKVLESVEEFIAEGDTLKHCVFVNDYHIKKDALILSARIEGVPIETIEVSLKNFKIIQSRGFQNHPSEHNKKIVALVRKNIPEIKKITLQKSA